MRRMKHTMIIAGCFAAAVLCAFLAFPRFVTTPDWAGKAYEVGTVVTNEDAIPLSIRLAAMSESPPWRRFPESWPHHYIRTNGLTCAVWKWPTATWDLERRRLSDEFRIWVKDDDTSIVPTPPFFLSGNARARPPRLTAARALAIAQMKTGFYTRAINTVDDFGDYFRITFVPRRHYWTPDAELRWEAGPHSTVAWVRKADWSVCGNPLSPVPALTEQEVASLVASVTECVSYDKSLPLKIDRVADMTIVALPEEHPPLGRNGLPNLITYSLCIWIDNSSKKVLSSFLY